MLLACREVLALATDDWAETLPLGHRALVRLHLGVCPYCKCYMRQLGQTVAALRDIPPEPLPDATHDALMALYRGRKT